jgi:hypothetical protein
MPMKIQGCPPPEAAAFESYYATFTASMAEIYKPTGAGERVARVTPGSFQTTPEELVRMLDDLPMSGVFETYRED